MVYYGTGVLLHNGTAEIIPAEPDPGNSGAGKHNVIFRHSRSCASFPPDRSRMGGTDSKLRTKQKESDS